jgi:hypothetical protein
MTTFYAPLTIEDVRELLPGVSERELRKTIREHKCCSVIGGKMYLELEDFQLLLQETKLWRSKSSGGTGSHTSTGHLAVNAYEKALELATRKSRNLSERKKKRAKTAPPSTAKRTRQPSLTLVSNT